MDKRPLAFWEVVVAAFLGSLLADGVQELHNNPDFAPYRIPAAIAIAVLIPVGFWVVAQMTGWREMRQLHKNELNEARAHGFESYAEYMAVHGLGEDVRESWAKVAASEKRKRG